MRRLEQRLVGLWLALWRRAAPQVRPNATGIVLRPFVSDAPMRGLMAWAPDWKTRAIGAILERRPSTLIDVGANVGQTLLDFLSAPAGTYYLGFEPNPTCAEHLTQLLSVNALERCRVVPAALGDFNGVGTLHRFGGDADPGASTRRDLRPDLPARATPIATFRLDDLGDIIPPGEISLVKIDTEGNELEVLRGMEGTIRKSQPWILCEVLHRDAAADADLYCARCGDLMALIGGLHYVALRIVQDDRGDHIRALRPVDDFPDEVWNEGSERACDYLFVPAADAQAALECLVP